MTTTVSCKMHLEKSAVIFFWMTFLSLISAFRLSSTTKFWHQYHHVRLANKWRTSHLWVSTDAVEPIRTLGPGSHKAEMEVKKSRFIGYAKNVDSWEDAKRYIDEVKQEHPKGRHWCYGFQCGINPVTERSSDDGEPTGTAGAPILGMFSIRFFHFAFCVAPDDDHDHHQHHCLPLKAPFRARNSPMWYA